LEVASAHSAESLSFESCLSREPPLLLALLELRPLEPESEPLPLPLEPLPPEPEPPLLEPLPLEPESEPPLP
jgi:hypothetical protein